MLCSILGLSEIHQFLGESKKKRLAFFLGEGKCGTEVLVPAALQTGMQVEWIESTCI